MYHVYETDAIILASAPRGEAGKSYIVLTRDMGLIRAVAQGVRMQKSKLRPFLVEMKPFRISLVRGKECWRITNAKEGDGISLSGEALSTYARVSNLIRMLVHGEEKDEKLFNLMNLLHEDFRVAPSNILRSLEEIAVLRTLSLLGYVHPSETLIPFLDASLKNKNLVDNFTNVRKEALVAINKALEVSQMRSVV